MTTGWVFGVVSAWHHADDEEERNEEAWIILRNAPAATIAYYRGIEYGVLDALGQDVLPPMTIEDLDRFRMMYMGAARDSEGMTTYLMEGIRNHETAHCENLPMACNTGYMVINELQHRTHLPIVSIVDACRDAAKEAGYHKLIQMGTEGTMNGRFFKEPFQDAGIKIIAP